MSFSSLKVTAFLRKPYLTLCLFNLLFPFSFFFVSPGENNECQRKSDSVNAGCLDCNCCVLGIYQQVIVECDTHLGLESPRVSHVTRLKLKLRLTMKKRFHPSCIPEPWTIFKIIRSTSTFWLINPLPSCHIPNVLAFVPLPFWVGYMQKQRGHPKPKCNFHYWYNELWKLPSEISDRNAMRNPPHVLQF